MKGGIAAAALAALTGGVQAAYHGHGHGHIFAKRHNGTGEICVPGCTTVWSTITGEATLVPITMTTTAISTNTTTVTIMTSPPSQPSASVVPVPAPAPVPTPQPKVLPTPGTYTFPATTVTVSQTTTVCAATSTKVPAGTHVVGGVTTVVETATTVTCPVATVVTSGSVTTSTIVQTEYVCPSAGTYTIAPITTAVSQETVIVYPVPTSYAPGTYVAPRRVVTVTETGYVYVCPFTSSGLSTATPQPTSQPSPPVAPPAAPPASTHEVPAASSSEVVVPVAPSSPAAPVAPSSPAAPVVPSSPAAPLIPSAPAVPLVPTKAIVPVVPSAVPAVPSQKHSAPPAAYPVPSTPAPAPAPAGPGGLVSHNDHFGITYTPYQPSNGQCKGAEQVDKDIAELKKAGFTTVRVYSTDCNTLENVGGACQKHGVGMIVGVFVKGGCSYESPDIKEQVDKLAKWDKWDMVRLLVVGNEAIMNGHCSPQQLRALITTVKAKCSRYAGPYTISETLNIWQRPDVSAAICGVVDVTGANIHPYFNADVTAQSAGRFVASQLELLGKVCHGNDVINLECGWPTRGSCNGKACPGKAEQAHAIQSIRETTGSKTVFFSYEDDMWKDAGACGCEQSWGTAASFAMSLSL
ncbi:hypothetical protein CDD83_7323 [Cordyceps sp. RAO-2017]|nr:hypothetical protein CDD83_7323 [Cordyceps sp. RAO-2017]